MRQSVEFQIEKNLKFTFQLNSITHARDDTQINIEKSCSLHFDPSEYHYRDKFINPCFECLISHEFTLRALNSFNQRVPHVLNLMPANKNCP